MHSVHCAMLALWQVTTSREMFRPKAKATELGNASRIRDLHLSATGSPHLNFYCCTRRVVVAL